MVIGVSYEWEEIQIELGADNVTYSSKIFLIEIAWELLWWSGFSSYPSFIVMNLLALYCLILHFLPYILVTKVYFLYAKSYFYGLSSNLFLLGGPLHMSINLITTVPQRASSPATSSKKSSQILLVNFNLLILPLNHYTFIRVLIKVYLLICSLCTHSLSVSCA